MSIQAESHIQNAAKASIEPDLKTELVIIENPLVDFDF